MPRKQQDPAIKVLEYFETADPAAAKLVLELCAETLRKRTGAPKTAPKKKKPAAGPGPGPSTVGD